jgi:hypothetical protein
MPLPSVLIYPFGFIGLAAVGLLPLRSWQVSRSFLSSGTPPSLRKELFAFAALVAAAALWSDMEITVRIFKCLTETYCGPGVASGWTNLAMLGVVYLAFEAVMFVLRRVGRLKAIKPGV